MTALRPTSHELSRVAAGWAQAGQVASSLIHSRDIGRVRIAPTQPSFRSSHFNPPRALVSWLSSLPVQFR